jgi:hypothetical protein
MSHIPIAQDNDGDKHPVDVRRVTSSCEFHRTMNSLVLATKTNMDCGVLAMETYNNMVDQSQRQPGSSSLCSPNFNMHKSMRGNSLLDQNKTKHATYSNFKTQCVD